MGEQKGRPVGERHRLIATGTCNWDYYVVEDRDRVLSIAKPGSGCSDSSFGSRNYFWHMVLFNRRIFRTIYTDPKDPTFPFVCPLTTRGESGNLNHMNTALVGPEEN